MTSTNDKIRALFLTALMVVSVFGATIAFSGAAAAEASAERVILYDDGGTQKIEIAYTEDVVVAGDAYAQVFVDGNQVENTTAVARASTGLVEITVNEVYTNGSVTVTTSGINDSTGGTPSVDVSARAVTVAPLTVDASAGAGTDANAYKGTKVALELGAPGSALEIEGPSGFFFDGSAPANSSVFVFDTAGKAFGTYTIDQGADGDVDANVTVRDLGLSATADDTSIFTTDNLTVSVSANAGSRELQAQLLDNNGDVVQTLTQTSAGDGSATFDFGTEAAGTYSVEVTDLTSGVQDSTSDITVSTAPEGDANFASGVFSEHRGDVAAITIDITGTVEPTVYIGSQADGFLASAQVTDGDGDGQVTVLLNTFKTPGAPGTYLSVSDADDSLSNVQEHVGVTAPIVTGTYDLNTTVGGQEADVASLSIDARSTDSVSASVAPSGLAGQDAIDAATPASEIALNDKVVIQVEASGLYGNLTGNPLNGNIDGLRLRAVEQDPGQNQAANTFIANTSLTIDAANNTFYTVIDTSMHGIQSGDEYEVTFYIDHDAGATSPNFASANPLLTSDQSVSTTFSVVDRTASFSNDPVVVRNAANQTITGTSSVAPGTELTISVRKTGDNAFLNSQQVVVQSDGTWSASFDFSGIPQGTEFTASIRNFPNANTDGLVSGPSTVTFNSQTTSGSQVTVSSVYLPAGGFVAIHEGSAGGPVIGSSNYLAAGTHSDVTITLTEPYTEAQNVNLVAMPHQDTNNNKVYEFGAAAPDVDADGPYLTDGGAPVTSSASVTVERATPEPRTVTVIQPSPTPQVITKTVVKPSPTPREVTVTVTQTTGQPGFGIAVAVVALLAAALLAVRRRD